MNQEVQHVVSLTAHLKTGLDPIEICDLEELCGLE